MPEPLNLACECGHGRYDHGYGPGSIGGMEGGCRACGSCREFRLAAVQPAPPPPPEQRRHEELVAAINRASGLLQAISTTLAKAARYGWGRVDV